MHAICVCLWVCARTIVYSVPSNLFPNNETWKESKIFLISDKLMHKKMIRLHGNQLGECNVVLLFQQFIES